MARVRSRMSLDGDWELVGCAPDSGCPPQGVAPQEGWRPCEVPGTVQRALRRLGEISDPLHGTSSEEARWIEEWTWWYRRSFEASPEMLGGGEVSLCFDGLDTFATVWLNGSEVGRHENQFVAFTAEVGPLLRDGSNELVVRLDPVAASVRGRPVDGLWQEYENLEALHARKCQASFGWDLAPRLVTAGIWRSVSLDLRAPLNIESVSLRTVALTEAEASVRIDVELGGALQEQATLEIELYEPLTGAPVAREEIVLGAVQGATPGADAATPDSDTATAGAVTATLAVAAPQLWWPIELGEQPLYRWRALLRGADGTLDEQTGSFGIREVRLNQTRDADGESFTFEVNGVPIFCKGSNWVPCDAETLRGSAAQYRSLIELARDAGVNMMRVWGGGIYEEPEFYAACDELGVLVWQDFMYSCAVYPHADAHFLALAEQEARAALRALRNHPSIVVWCGNNECQWLHGSHRHEDPTLPERMPGLDFFETTLAEICAQLDGTRPYLPTSPWGGEHPNCATHGDRHAYKVGFGELDGEDYGMDLTWPTLGPAGYREERPRFVSEFAAIPAPPEPEALARFLAPEDRWSGSPAWRHHMPAWPDGIDFQAMLDFFCASLFGVPSEGVIDRAIWQRHARLVQGAFLELGLRELRRQWPDCGGALFWQFNSMWPSMDWGVVDYYGHPKPGYYFAKRALQPVLAILRPASSGPECSGAGASSTMSLGCECFALVEGREPKAIRFELAAGSFDGSAREVADGETVLAPREVSKLDLEVPAGHDYLCLTVQANGAAVSRDFHFLTDPRATALPPATLEAEIVEWAGSRARLRVSSDVFARAVRIGAYGARCSDNYFDIEPRGEREIEVDLTRAESPVLEVSALNAPRALHLIANEPAPIASS